MARSIDTQPGVRGFVPAQNDEERFLMRHVEDLARAAFVNKIFHKLQVCRVEERLG